MRAISACWLPCRPRASLRGATHTARALLCAAPWDGAAIRHGLLFPSLAVGSVVLTCQ